MARIAAAYSDYAILTSDNPRSEDPLAILEDMEAGLIQAEVPHTNYTSIIDRKEAIGKAIQLAEQNDIIVIAGKGHETYQQLKDQTIHFDDREVALEAIQRKQIG
jgi:UDP-N-acetylmuramoyl-L-alanyl-D-glutamate--2,6-diaminopimelate ligase